MPKFGKEIRSGPYSKDELLDCYPESVVEAAENLGLVLTPPTKKS